MAPNQPVQQRTYGVKPISYQNYTFTPIARLDIEARILSKKKYYEDQEAEFAPYDLVVGWGPMSDERNLDKILVKQSDRSFFFEMIEPPIPVQKMNKHTANLRLVTSEQATSEEIQDLRVGHVIRVKGFLVNVKDSGNWSTKTSLIRNDIGKEAAEIIWVNELTVM